MANKGFFWLAEVGIGFIFLLLFGVLFFNYLDSDNGGQVFALQKANDVLRANSYSHEEISKDVLDQFFGDFGYICCVDLMCYSNDIIQKNKLVKTAKILFKNLTEKEVSLTVFYN